MQSLVLHIGTHKSGSTTLQTLLTKHREELLDTGVLYPRSGCPDGLLRFGHHMLIWELKGRAGSEGSWKAMLGEVARAGSRARTVVLSSEVFSLCDEVKIAQIAANLEGFNVQVVVYLRNQFDFMVSMYKQLMKSGAHFPSFRSFQEEKIHWCYYDRLLEQWMNVFGRDRVSARVYDRLKQEPGLERDFFELLPIDPVCRNRLLAQSRPQNVSPPDEVLNVVRILNWLQHSVNAESYLGARLADRASRARNRILHRAMKLRQSGSTGGAWERVASLVLRRPLYDESDMQWLRESLVEHNAVFLERYLEQHDHRYFEF